MGKLVDGVWQPDDPALSRGATKRDTFVRPDSTFRSWITPDGESGPSGEGGFAATPGRYHLYIGHACPRAHRTHIFLELKKLDGMISHSVVHWFMGEQGWSFAPGDGVIPDPVNGAEYLHQVYTAADPRCSSRVTIPCSGTRNGGRS